MEKPLVTFAIVSYNNYKYIKEALNSVFIQTYPNIQLIISNDASSDFDEDDLINYLNANRTDNIKQIIVNNNERNIGTVKNIKYCKENAEGEFIMYMAADDALYDENVISRYIAEFDKLGKDAMIVCSKIAMCGHELNEIIEFFPDEEGINAIKNFQSNELFSRLSHTFTIPTSSSCYRIKLFDIVGDYDEDYFIIEDAQLYLRMARLGIKFYWIDDHIGARHRDGGISHGNKLNLSEAYRKYRYDEIILFKKEILPYKQDILADDYKKMMHKWEYIERAYFQTFILPNLKGKEKLKYISKNIPSLLIQVLKRSKAKILELSYDEFFCKDLWKTIIYCFLSLFMITIVDNFIYPIFSYGLNKVVITGIVYTMMSLILVFLMMYILRFIYRFYLSVKFILTGR